MSILSLHDRAEQITFEVSTDKSVLRISDISQSVEDYLEEFEPEQKYMTRIKIEMSAVDDEGESVMDIGSAECIFFESEMVFAEETSFFDLCDAVTSDVATMAELFSNRDGGIDPSVCPPNHNLMYIKTIYIEENCRGLGAGGYLLNNLNPLLSRSLNLHPHVSVVLPYPQTKEGNAAEEEADANLPRLIRFYEKVGFEKLGGSAYMIKRHRDDFLSFLLGEEE
jgi:GNAT superfamily N-acetyltransferase